MAWAKVQSNSNSAASGTSITVTLSAVGSGNAVCGCVGFSSAETIVSVKDNNNNDLNVETEITDTGNTQKFAAFSKTNITNAPTSITVTFNANCSFLEIIAEEFSGGSTASIDERDGAAHGGQFQTTPGTGTDAITSGTFTTTVNGDLLYGAVMNANNATLRTKGTNFTDGTNNTGQSYVIQTEYREQATAGASTAATFTQAAGVSNVTFLIALKPAAGAAANVAKPLMPSLFGRGKRPWSKLRTSPLSRIPATGTADLSGSATLTFSPSGALQGDSALAGTSTLTFSPSGALAGSAALSGATSLTFAPSATLLASALMSGASSLTFTPSASLAGTSALSGATSLTFTPSASLAGDAALSGSTTLTFAPSAALVGDAALSGASSLTFTSSADLTISSATTADLAGASSITFSPSATLAGGAALSGVSSITFLLAGDLSGGAIVGSGANQNFPFIANVGTLMSR